MSNGMDAAESEWKGRRLKKFPRSRSKVEPSVEGKIDIAEISKPRASKEKPA